MFSTLVCVFTLDRIGRRKTLYWGSICQGIAMFLVGGLSRGGIQATDAGNVASANKWGAAAASMVFLYTCVVGATWLTVSFGYLNDCVLINPCPGSMAVPRRNIPCAMPCDGQQLGCCRLEHRLRVCDHTPRHYVCRFLKH
jgi:hypothetical protein